MEGNSPQSQTEDHARRRDEHDSAPPNDIDVFERDKSEDEVGAGDDEADGGRLVEADLLEERCGVVHQSVESAKLLESLHAAGDDYDFDQNKHQSDENT